MDLLNWFLGSAPTALRASGSNAAVVEDRYECLTSIAALYEYGDRVGGAALASLNYQNCNHIGSHLTCFMGTEGTLIIPDWSSHSRYIPAPGKTLKPWMQQAVKEQHDHFAAAAARFTKRDGIYQLLQDCPVRSQRRPAVPIIASLSPVMRKEWKEKKTDSFHLENFFDAVAANDPTKLNCPPEAAAPATLAFIDTVHTAEEG